MKNVIEMILIGLLLITLGCEGGEEAASTAPVDSPDIVEGDNPDPDPEPVSLYNTKQLITEEMCHEIIEWQLGNVDPDTLQFWSHPTVESGHWWHFDEDGVQLRALDGDGNPYNWGGFYSDETVNVGQCQFHIVSSIVGIDEVWWEGVQIY